MGNSLKKKKNSVNFLTKIPKGHIGKEFCSECKVGIFALKLLDSMFKGPRKKRKSIWKNKKKKTRINFVRQYPKFRPVNDFGRNITSIFLHEKLWVAFIEAQETNGKFLKKKKKTRLIFLRKYPKVLPVKNFVQNAKTGFLPYNF